MQTIVYQCRPPEDPTWYAVPAAFVPNFRAMGYQVRELVPRDEAEQAVKAAQKMARAA